MEQQPSAAKPTAHVSSWIARRRSEWSAYWAPKQRQIQRTGLTAKSELTRYFWVGLVLEFGGSILAAANWPSQEFQAWGFDPGGEWVKTGDPALTFFGLALVNVGALMMLVAIIGWGVKLGMRAADEDRSLT